MFESRVFSARRLLFLLTLSCLPACHREPVSEAVPAAKPGQATGVGSVWVADREGQSGRLFLCGTIHVLRETDYPLPPGYEAAYKHSDKLVLELPPGSGADSALTTRMRELGTYGSDSSLEANVMKETWAAVQKWAPAHGQKVASLNRFRPWFVSLIITSTEYGELGARQAMGVDQYFESKAARDGKPGIGLETVELQLKLFSSLTPEQQKGMLEQTLAEASTLSQEYEKMISAWKNGELEALQGMLFDEAERFPELMDIFLKSRNLAWIDRLDAMLKNKENAMILVGTGHLASKDGLIQLLKDRGYRVRHFREVPDL